MQYLKQSTAFIFRIGPFVDSTDGVTAETGLTIAQADIQISKAGAAFAQTSDATPTTTHDTDGWYQCPLTTTDTATLGTLDVQVTMAGALPVWKHYNVVPANVFDSMFSTDKLEVDITQLGGVTQSATDLKDFADAGYDPATNKVQGVVLVDTTTTNTDVRGTNSAALASVCTEARLAELDAANLPTDVAAIPTAVENRTEMDSNSTQLAAIVADTVQLSYAGPRGLGVFLDDAAANTNTVLGVDGIESNPVSTIAAATTLAGSLGSNRIYLINDSVITLAQTYEGWEFIGTGLGNQITLGSQDVDNSVFFFMTVTGTQGGTGMIWIEDCSMTALVSLECIAKGCYLTGTNTIRASTQIIFDQCLSAVPGNNTPELTFSGGTSNVNFRHYSGGLQLNSMATGDTMSYESDGQIVVDATCTDGLLTVRGNCDITDNAGGNVTITQSAAVNQANINAECDTALSDIKLDHLVAVADADDPVDDSIIAKLANSAATADWSAYVNTTDSLQAIRDRGDAAWVTGAGGSDRLLMVDTTIATLASQTSFTLTAGSADNDAYNNCTIVVEDATTATQKAVGLISAYTGATKTVTLKYDPGVFTMAATDKVYILAENGLKSTAANRQLDVTATGAAGIDWANVENPATAVDLAGTDIQLVDTATVNSDMRGTDSAALASVCTEARLAELAAANLPADVDAILVDTAAIGAAGAGLTDLGGMSTGMKAEVNAEALDVLATDTYAEPGQGAPPATASIEEKLSWLFLAFRNKITETASEQIIFADDTTTEVCKAAMSDDATTFEKGEMATGV